VIPRAPERRFRERLLWQHPVLIEAELDDYAKGDRRVELGASCGACGRPLAYPLVQMSCGGRGAPLLHPGRAVAVAEGLLRDAEGL
jgi:hypothetical protein